MLSESGEAQTGRHFNEAIFFDSWFKDYGHAFFFLFKKNLSVTNIQFGELLALLRRHTRETRSGRNPSLLFLTADEFKDSSRELALTFAHIAEEEGKRADFLRRQYGAIFRKTVVVTSYYGSCAVFLPPNLTLNLALVCGESGYIHSCGYNVFIRNAAKTNKGALAGAIKRHLERNAETGANLPFFLAYAHEDFTSLDRYMRSDLHKGLDDVKIYLEKSYVGPDRLVNVLAYLQEVLDGKIHVAPPGDPKEVHDAALQAHSIDEGHTLWLIKDRSIGEPLSQPGNDVYYICYDQRYYNANPFHIFDENKPGWMDHTTIPHTLMGAMINISSPLWPDSRVAVGDPFLGSGTTLFECVKFPHVLARGSDIEPLTGLLTRDNQHFLSKTAREIDVLLVKLDYIIETGEIAPPRFSPVKTSSKKFEILLEEVDGTVRLQADLTEDFFLRIPSDLHQECLGWDPFQRLKLYLAFRTLRRNVGSLLRGTLDWPAEYRRQTRELRVQMERLLEIRGCSEALRDVAVEETPLMVVQGRYSLWVTIAPDALRSVKLNARTATAEKIPRKEFDVIVTDPPYGINTGESPVVLAELYTESLKAMIRGLVPGGQLVLCLPERSYIGRPSPVFATRAIVTQQILAAAADNGYEVVNPVAHAPTPANLFRPPYYWESEKALARSITHFPFQELPRHEAESDTDDNQLDLFDSLNEV